MPLYKPSLAPTITKLTSGASNYTTPAGTIWIRATLVGAGGAGSGSGSAAGGTGGTGGNATFGTLTAGGGAGGVWNAGGSSGGTPTVGAGWTNIHSMSGSAGYGTLSGMTNNYFPGSMGGAGAFGGNQPTGSYNNTGTNSTANSGSGGQGGGGNSQTGGANNGSAGGAGALVIAIIAPTPGQVFAYSVPGAATGGTAGTTGLAGGNSGSGLIIIEEFYQ
jgi:hypothetical protein